MEITNIADSVNRIVSNTADSLSALYGDIESLSGYSVWYNYPFEQINVPFEKVYSPVSDVFGQSAVLHSDLDKLPSLASTNPESMDFAVWQYIVVICLLIYVSVLVYKFSDYVGRLLMMAFSFPVLYRHLSSTNNTLDSMSRYISFSLFPIGTLLFISLNRYYPSLFSAENIIVQILIVNIVTLICFVLSFIVRRIFYSFSKRRYFFKRLFIADRICISSYILISFPVILLASVDNPYQNVFVLALFLMMALFLIHNIITVFKLFIEEKVSYVQLILYFCTVKAVIISVIVFFVFYIYHHSLSILFIL